MTVRRRLDLFWRMKALPAALVVLLALGGATGFAGAAAFVRAAGTPPDGVAPAAEPAADVRARAAEPAADVRAPAAEPAADVRARAVSVDASVPAGRRLQLVFQRLVAVVSKQHPEVSSYTVEVVDEKVPNAWINQDNEIFVTRGLLELLESDDQLAGVLGHEIAHGTLGHIPHRIQQSLWSAFAVFAIGSISGGQGGSDWGGLLHMRDLFMYAFSREQESEADLAGMRYARDAGYRSEGLVESLKLLDDDRRRLPDDSVWQELYRTHPPMSQRVMDLRLILAAEQLQQARGNGGLPSGFGGGGGAGSPEDAARGFVRALLEGDGTEMGAYTLPGRTPALLTGAEAVATPGPWDDAELEVVRREDVGLATVLVARLWRPATPSERAAGLGQGRDEAEIPSSPLRLVLRQSARGWVVAEWTPWRPSDGG